MHPDGLDPAVDGVFVLKLSGELDLATAPTVVDRGMDALHLDWVRVVVVDLAAVTFIDSTAVRALVELHGSAEHAGVPLRMRSVPTRVRRILEITGLDQVFVIEDD